MRKQPKGEDGPGHDPRILFLSLKPKFADAILDGRKTAEIRRLKPDISPGSIVYVYCTTPIKAILGMFRVDTLISESVSALWRVVGKNSVVTRKEFFEYLHGSILGHAILITEISALSRPLPLEELRSLWPGFHPPQSYFYLDGSDPRAAGIIDAVAELLPTSS